MKNNLQMMNKPLQIVNVNVNVNVWVIEEAIEGLVAKVMEVMIRRNQNQTTVTDP